MSIWSVTFYGDFRSYMTTLRKAGVIAYDPEGSRKAKMLDQLLDTRSGNDGDEDDPESASIDVENAEELADILAALRADKDGGYGYGVRYSRQSEEAQVWSAIGSTGFYGERCAFDTLRVNTAAMGERATKAIRDAHAALSAALSREI